MSKWRPIRYKNQIEPEETVELRDTHNVYREVDQTLVADEERLMNRYVIPDEFGAGRFGYNAIGDFEVRSLRADRIRAGQIGAELITLNDDNVRIDGPNRNIVISDGTIDRVTVGKHGSDYGIEVLDANGDILYNEEKIKIQHTFSTWMESPSTSGQSLAGIIAYIQLPSPNESVSYSKAVPLDFVKPPDFTVTEATAYYRFQDYIYLDDDGAGNAITKTGRCADVNLILNPTKNLEEVTVAPHVVAAYYRYTSGDVIEEGINPSSDDFVGSSVFSAGEVSNIDDGLNSLVLQVDTVSTDDTEVGYASLTLVLTGYLEPA